MTLPDGLGPRAGRRHELDGDVLPEPARHGARARRARTPSTRTSPASSGSTSSTSRTRSSARTSPGIGLWDEQDGFFYDEIHHAGRPPESHPRPLARRAAPALRGRHRRLEARSTGSRASSAAWSGSSQHRPDLTQSCASMTQRGGSTSGSSCRSSRPDQLTRVLRYMLDETEFLSPYGIRSVSQYHRDHPYATQHRAGASYRLDYEPGESTHGALRRQLQLARPDLVPDQLPDPRVAPAVPPCTSATTFRSSARPARAT